MEVTRIRELTPDIVVSTVGATVSRNGSYPNKGIDTYWTNTIGSDGIGRNGSYPNKGIDTCPPLSLLQLALCVEMEVTRIRELTHAIVVAVCEGQCCRNGSYPNKGIDTIPPFSHYVFRFE